MTGGIRRVAVFIFLFIISPMSFLLVMSSELGVRRFT
jgi:hypothetical protein